MSREAGGTTVLLVGVLLLRLVLTDAHLRYVRPAMGPWLFVAGAALVVVGGVALARALRRPVVAGGVGSGDHEGHGHSHSDRVGWLLLVPVLAVLLAPPPALGSFGVDRGVTITSSGRTFPALPDDGLTHPMSLVEYGERAADAAGASFAGRPVELTGFVAAPEDGGPEGTFRIARYQISCCAADAIPAVVRVHDPNRAAPARDTWVVVTGTFRGTTPDDVAEIDAAAVGPIDTPLDPYES